MKRIIGSVFLLAGAIGYAAPSVSGMGICGFESETFLNGNGLNLRSATSPCWVKGVRVSGVSDLGYFQSKDRNRQLKRFDLFSTALMADAKVGGAWRFKTTLSYAWSGDGFYPPGSALVPRGLAQTNLNFMQRASLHLDEAMLSYAHFDQSPLYFRIGQGYINFGHYTHPYALLPNMMQAFSQLNKPHVELGWVGSNGLFLALSGWTENGVTRNNQILARAAKEYQGVVKFGFNQWSLMPGVGLSADLNYITNLETIVGRSPYFNANSIVSWANEPNVSGALGHLALSLPMNFDLNVNYLKASRFMTQGLEIGHIKLWEVDLGYHYDIAGLDHAARMTYEHTDDFYTREHIAFEYSVRFNQHAQLYAQYSQLLGGLTARAFRPKVWVLGLKASF